MLYSCSPPEYLPQEDLQAYVRDEANGLSRSVEINHIKMQVLFRPTDLLVAQELRGVTVVTDSLVQEKRKKYAPYYYFILSISSSDKDILDASSGHAGFSELLQTVSFRMNQVVNLTTPGDTIPVADFVYNRTFGLSKSTDILLVFDKSEIGTSDWVQVNLDEFGLGAGKQSVRFKTTDLHSAPKIYAP
jgi:hypothetical protein